MFRILVADDDKNTRILLKAVLEGEGYTVLLAEDGALALKALEREHIDLVVLDVMMPNMNGWDAARMIRSMKRSDAGTIPIIAMSANALAEDMINSRISGMNRHLTKPLEEKKLMAAFKECQRKI